MKLINLTGHDIIILDDADNIVNVIKSSGCIRVNQTTVRSENFHPVDYPISHTTYGDAFLPPVIKDTVYIVSSIVRQSCLDRIDLVIPSETVYNDRVVVGCRSLDQKKEVINNG